MRPAEPCSEDAIRFRPAGPSDWRAVAKLHAASWRAAYKGIFADAFLDGPIGPEREAIWRDRLREPIDPGQITVLAESEPSGADGPLAFCCILAGHDPRWGSLIDNLHVRPGLGRQRLGRRVLKAALEQLPARWAGLAIHLTVLDRNAAAIGAYERWGGAMVERLVKHEPDGLEHPIRRYAWASPAALAGRLDSAS